MLPLVSQHPPHLEANGYQRPSVAGRSILLSLVIRHHVTPCLQSHMYLRRVLQSVE